MGVLRYIATGHWRKPKPNPGITQAGQQIREVYNPSAELPAPVISNRSYAELGRLMAIEDTNKNRIHLDKNPHAANQHQPK